MRGSWVYNYYCDESCHLQKDGKRFMVLGYIAAPLHKIEQMKGELKSLRVKYKNTLEVKWTYSVSYTHLVRWPGAEPGYISVGILFHTRLTLG